MMTKQRSIDRASWAGAHETDSVIAAATSVEAILVLRVPIG